MIDRLIQTAIAAAAMFAPASAFAAAACDPTPRIAALQRAWANPRGPVLIAAHRGGPKAKPPNSLFATRRLCVPEGMVSSTLLT